MKTNFNSKQFLGPLAIVCALALSPRAEAQSPIYPSELFPSTYTGLVWTAGGNGNWNTTANWDYSLGDGTYYVRDGVGVSSDLNGIESSDYSVYFENPSGSPFNIALTSDVVTADFSVAQGTVIVNLNGFTMNVDTTSFNQLPYVPPPSPGMVIFNGAGVVNIDLGGQIAVGSGGSANNTFNSATPSAPFPYSATGGATVNVTFASGASVSVGSDEGGINNSAIFSGGNNTLGTATINAGSATGASNNRIVINGGTTTLGDTTIADSGVDGVNAKNRLVITNGAVVSTSGLLNIGSYDVGDGLSGTGAGVFVKQGGRYTVNAPFVGSIAQLDGTLSVDGEGSAFNETAPHNSGSLQATIELYADAHISVTNGATFNTVSSLRLLDPNAHPTITVDKASTMNVGDGVSGGGLGISATQTLTINGGGIANFNGGYSAIVSTDPTYRQVDTGAGALSVKSFGGLFNDDGSPSVLKKGTTYYIPVTGTLIVGTGGISFPQGQPSTGGGFFVGAGTNLQLAGGNYTGNGSLLAVEPGGMLSGTGATGAGVAVILNGGTLRVGSDSATQGSQLSFNAGSNNVLTHSSTTLATTAPSTFAFTVFGFGGTGGSFVNNYDQIAMGSGAPLDSGGFTNTISLNLKMDHDGLMTLLPGANGDQYQFFANTASGAPSAAVNLGSVNFSYGTSAAQLASVGLAWDPDATSFATTGLMGLKEVAWMQLNNSASVDAATALTINNGIRSAADGFSGNGVNGTFQSQTVKGAGWSVTGSAANGTPIAAGGNLTAGTTAFTPGSNTTLNGNYTGVVTANFDLGNGVQGSQTWNLSHKISGIVADSGQAGLIAGQSYAGFGLTSTRGTTATILGGTVSGDTTLTMGFAPNSNPALKSDILTLTGVAHTGSFGFHNSTLTDEYVLEIGYNGSAGVPFEVAWFDMMANGGSGEWVNAISGNSDSTGDILDASNAIVGAYAGETTLGQYGYDPATQTAWAVVDHSSDFAAMPLNVPEPGSWAMLTSALGMLLGFHRPNRGKAETGAQG